MKITAREFVEVVRAFCEVSGETERKARQSDVYVAELQAQKSEVQRLYAMLSEKDALLELAQTREKELKAQVTA